MGKERRVIVLRESHLEIAAHLPRQVVWEQVGMVALSFDWEAKVVLPALKRQMPQLNKDITSLIFR
jgi:hypothetical protein